MMHALTAVREDIYVWSDKWPYVFPGCACSDGGNLCDWERVGRKQQAVPLQVVYLDTGANFDNSLPCVLLGRLKSVKHEWNGLGKFESNFRVIKYEDFGRHVDALQITFSHFGEGLPMRLQLELLLLHSLMFNKPAASERWQKFHQLVTSWDTTSDDPLKAEIMPPCLLFLTAESSLNKTSIVVP